MDSSFIIYIFDSVKSFLLFLLFELLFVAIIKGLFGLFRLVLPLRLEFILVPSLYGML